MIFCHKQKHVGAEKIILVLMFGILIFIIGCTATEKAAVESIKEKAAPEASQTGELKVVGPAGCTSGQECGAYCGKKPFDCKAWCDIRENKPACDHYGLKINIPSGIPGSSCTADTDCYSGLICVDYNCAPPTPENLAKKSGFQLPGGCVSMVDCAKYCAQPEHKETCTDFCKQFPSFCQDLNAVRASAAPPECRECTTCEAKDCILDCTYRCYQYTPVPSASQQDINVLQEGIVFKRNYQEPIKAVWEPGPAYNRIGLTYFIDDYKNIGVNTYSITPKYNHKEGTLTHTVDHADGEKADNEKIANIIKAKKAGMQAVLVAHDLYDLFPDVAGKSDINFEDYYDDLEATALKWAEVAEKYQVEYFVPVNEFEYVLYENGYSVEQACEITNGLYKKIIPKVRNIFKGKVYCRVGGMDGKFGCMDFSLCDVFGFTYGFDGGEPKANFEAAFKVGEQLVEKYGKKYVMAEAFMLLINGQTISDCINLHKAGMQAYKDTAKNGIGYTFMGLIQRDPINKNDCAIKDTELVDAYQDFFQGMN